MKRWGLHAGWLSGTLFTVALLAIGALTPGYRQSIDPVSVLGTAGVAHPAWWNAFGFVVPGMLVALFAPALAASMHGDRPGSIARIGLWSLLFSGIALGALGVFAYDLADPDGLASKLHVASLAIALLALLPAAALPAWSLRRQRAWRALVVLGPLLAPAMFLSVAIRIDEIIPGLRDRPGYVERVTLGLYFLWMALAASTALRRHPAVHVIRSGA